MSKMRSDCVFSKLTLEQVETLEGWLFEENLNYKEALERAQKEFGIGGSLTGLRRFYGRLAKERGRESLTEAMSACVEAAALGDNATLRAGLLTMANACAVQFMTESPKDIRQFTALLRALTSAQGQEMKWIKFEREDGWNWRSRMREEARKSKQEEENLQSVEVNGRGMREEKEERGIAAKESGAASKEEEAEPEPSKLSATSPRPLPVEGRGRRIGARRFPRARRRYRETSPRLSPLMEGGRTT